MRRTPSHPSIHFSGDSMGAALLLVLVAAIGSLFGGEGEAERLAAYGVLALL